MTDDILKQLRLLVADCAEVVWREVAELVRRGRGYPWVGLYELTDREFHAVAWTGVEAPAFPRFPRDKGLNGAAASSRCPVVCQDVSSDSRYLATFKTTGSEAIFPILDEAGQVVGTMDIESDRCNAFLSEDIEYLRACAAALQPMYVYRQMHAREQGEPYVDQFAIRAATQQDSPKITDLVFDVLREYDLAPDPETTDADLLDLQTSYAMRGGMFDVLEDGTRQIVGCVGLYPLDDRTCELRKMYLQRQLRGHGLGRRLLEHALHRAKRLGFHRVTLETASVLTEAIALYTRYGFCPLPAQHLSVRCDRAYYLDLDR